MGPDDSVDIVFDNFGAKGTADKMVRSIRSGGTFLVLLGGNGGTVSSHPKAGVKQVPFGMMTAGMKEFDELRALFETGIHSLAEPWSFGENRCSAKQEGRARVNIDSGLEVQLCFFLARARGQI